MTIIALQLQPENESVEVLEAALEMAKRGELRDVVIVGSVNDRDGFGYFRHAVFEDRWRLLGALEYAKHGVNNG